jgi:signal transduction histidine kinase
MRSTLTSDRRAAADRSTALTTTAGPSPLTSAASLGLRERRRLERHLHDGAQQRLVSLALTLRLAREKLDAEPSETGRLLDRSREDGRAASCATWPRSRLEACAIVGARRRHPGDPPAT